ncbi:hypothetical protein K1719_020793 [Acacia pycnantha]|nr:hypothetical protein K1719_020793 [Acacia pycnantha]
MSSKTNQIIARKPLFDCCNNVKMIFGEEFEEKQVTKPFPSVIHGIKHGKWKVKMKRIQNKTLPDIQGDPLSSNAKGPNLKQPVYTATAPAKSRHERDNMQKTEFLKALSDMWKDFDSRVLRYKVLPPLCAELRNVVMQPMILPMVLTIAESQDKSDFEITTLPALVPVLSSAAGETLLLFVKHAELLINKYGVEFVAEHVLPLVIPLLTTQQLNVQQFAKYMLFVKDMLRRLEKRGVVVTESGIPEVMKPFPPVNGLHNEVTSKTNSAVASTAKGISSWDDDWLSTSEGTTASSQSFTDKSSQLLPGIPMVQITSSQQYSSSSAVSNQQNQQYSTTGSLHGSTTSQNSLAYLKQSQGFPASNVPRAENKSADLGSIFAFDQNDLIAPRLAPPPQLQ